MANDRQRRPFPIGKVAFTLFGLAVGTAVAYELGVFKVKPRKVRCNSEDLLIYEGADGRPIRFSPDKFVAKLYNDLEGVTMLPDVGTPYYYFIADRLKENDLRCTHNAWLDLINKEESLYKFIDSQMPYGGSNEAIYQKKALNALAKAGLKMTG